MLLFALVVDLLHVDDLLLVDRGRRQEHDEVMPLLRRHLGRGARRDQAEIDIVDCHLGVVLGSPLLDVLVVEPLVVSRNEVTPLQDLQGLPRGMSRSGVDERTRARQQSYPGSRLDQVAARCSTTTVNWRFHDCFLSRYRMSSRRALARLKPFRSAAIHSLTLCVRYVFVLDAPHKSGSI